MGGPCQSERSGESRPAGGPSPGEPEIRLCFEENPRQSDVEFLSDALSAFNVRAVGVDDHQPLAIFLRDAAAAVVGGITGATYWGWFEVGLLWVREDLRGQGFGHRLLEAAEAEAIRRGCRYAVLDTFSFQAPAFYEARGYTVFGTLPDFPRGHSLFYMVKYLDDASPTPGE